MKLNWMLEDVCQRVARCTVQASCCPLHSLAPSFCCACRCWDQGQHRQVSEPCLAIATFLFVCVSSSHSVSHCLSVSLSLSVYLFLALSVRLPLTACLSLTICLSVSLPLFLCLPLSLCLCLSRSLLLSVCLSNCLCQSVSISFCLCHSVSVCLSASLSLFTRKQWKSIYAIQCALRVSGNMAIGQAINNCP